MSEDYRMGQLANALLPHLRNPEVASHVLGVARVSHPMQLPVCPPDAQALRLAKKNWTMAATIAGSTKSPAVLAKLSRDSRVNTRRQVAANPHIDEATALYLHGWAMKQHDEITARAVISRVPARTALATLGADLSLQRWSEYPHPELARRIVSEQDPEIVLEAARLCQPRLTSALAPKIYAGEVAGVSLTQLCEATDERNRSEALEACRLGSARVDEELAACTLRWADLLERFGAIRSFAHGAGEMSDEAARMLVRSRNFTILEGVARTENIPSDVVDRLIAAGEWRVSQHLASCQVHRLSAEQTEMLGRQLGQMANFNARIVSGFFAEAQHTFASETRVALVRRGTPDVTNGWLAGRYPHQYPQPGEILAWLADPGCSMGEPSRYATGPDDPKRRVAGMLSYSLEHALQRPWAQELVEGLGELFFEFNVSSSAGAGYLAKRLQDCLDEDAGAWHTALSFAANWTGGMEDLIETTCAALGRDHEPLTQWEPLPTPAELAALEAARKAEEERIEAERLAALAAAEESAIAAADGSGAEAAPEKPVKAPKTPRKRKVAEPAPGTEQLSLL